MDYFIKARTIASIILCLFIGEGILSSDTVSSASISEFLANNNKGILDEDEENSDWIELWNSNGEEGNLGGYHLTDDPQNLTKWTIPPANFNDEGYLLIFASGKDKKDPQSELHTNFRLNASGGYLALVMPDGLTIASEFSNYPEQFEDVSFGEGYGEPQNISLLQEGSQAKWKVPESNITNWNKDSFDDSDWNTGNTGIGYDNTSKYIPHIGEGGDVNTSMRGKNSSIYIRIPFNIDDARGISELSLKMKWEDGFIAYLNGKQIHSESAPDNPEWNSRSTSNRSNENDAISFFEYPISAPLNNGTNLLAIHGLNGSTNSSDFLISPAIEAKKTNIDKPELGYFLIPSPSELNKKIIKGLVKDTKFSTNRGFYEDPFELEITSATEGAEIRYTLDGTPPSESTGEIYSSPITIDQTTVVRAIAYKPNFSSTNIDTHTYVFTEDVVKQRTMSSSITENARYKPLMIDALKGLPTISLSLAEPNRLNTEEEKLLSIEMIFPDGKKGFQENAGVTHFGGYFTNFSKKSFRIYFRGEYGATKLRFPIFDGFEYDSPPAQEFDSINLRSGSHDMIDRGAYMSNRFTDDSMLEMGNIAPHGRFVHVYLNSQYWGMYHLRERWNAAMASEYFGGTKEDYEAINANNTGNEFLQGVVFDGDGQYWRETRNLINGNSPFSGASNHMDIPNMIDFMLLWTSGNSESEFRSVGSVPLGVPFKFFIKDADGYLRPPNHQVTHNGPLNAMTRLKREGDPDFKVLLADRIHKHYFNNGAMTAQRLTARLQKRVDEVKVPFLAEAARWTNVRGGRSNHSPTSWEAYQNNLLNNQLPKLPANMLARFRSAGMYPDLIAPVFSQHGGSIPKGGGITMSTNTIQIRYTLDGSDPRLSGGNINPTSISASFSDEAPIPKDFISTGYEWKYLDNGTDPGTSWFAQDFDDSEWLSGPSELGYKEGDEATLVNFVDSDPAPGIQRNATTYFRTTVELSKPSAYSYFLIRLKYDDGAAVYANGKELIRTNNLPIDAKFDTYATSGTPNERKYYEYQIPSSNFINGINHVAVEIHNSSPASSDISFDLFLRGEVDSSKGSRVTEAITLSEPALVKARAYNPSTREWSALNEAYFSIGSVKANANNLSISEFHYHPANPEEINEINVSKDRDDYEFIEFLNRSATPIELTNVYFKDGINFQFETNSIINANERAVIVRNREAFKARYGTNDNINILGQYSGRLSNDGETVILATKGGETLIEFTYNDQEPWAISADGNGPSLVLTGSDPNSPNDWKINSKNGGNPGLPDSTSNSNFEAWKLTNNVSDTLGDNDNDGIPNLAEYAFSTDPNSNTSFTTPKTSTINILNENYLEIQYEKNPDAIDISIIIESSNDLIKWDNAPLELISEERNEDSGKIIMTYRSMTPITENSSNYFRFKLSL